jgi:hypothetical protein
MRFSSVAASLVAIVGIYLHTRPVMAASEFFSHSGSGSDCTLSAPCQIQTAVDQEESFVQGVLSCADSSENGGLPVTISKSLTVDCVGTAGTIAAFVISGGAVVKLRNFTIWDANTAITLQGGTAILENVHITGVAINAILAQPTSPSTLIVRNCIIDSSPSGVLLKPGAGGSLSAVFDHVTISANNGGGIKIDTTNGPVTADISDSVISNNGGNGINAVGGAGGQAIVSIKNSVIAKNAVVGVQANGANAGIMIATTLLDQNAAGALSVVGGGSILTYGNNQVVGAQGSNFTGTAALK